MNDQLHLQALQSVAQSVNALQQTLSIRRVTVGTFSTLPTPPLAVEGMLAGVTDSTTATWGATITGGGSNHVLAYFDGSSWTVAAK